MAGVIREPRGRALRQADTNVKRSVGIVLFPGVGELGFVGPWHVFATLRRLDPETCRLFTVSETGGEVRCAGSLRVRADHAFGTAPRMDVLVVPGATGSGDELDDSSLIAYIRQAGAQADLVVSVCGGALLLDRAGFLAGKRSTTDRASLDRLRAPGTAEVVAGARWVDAGAVITASGGTAGIEVALYLVRRLWGEHIAHHVEQDLEYCAQFLGAAPGGGTV
jgi:transcriptional regulator GlxA family with amidase domain